MEKGESEGGSRTGGRGVKGGGRSNYFGVRFCMNTIVNWFWRGPRKNCTLAPCHAELSVVLGQPRYW